MIVLTYMFPWLCSHVHSHSCVCACDNAHADMGVHKCSACLYLDNCVHECVCVLAHTRCSPNWAVLRHCC